MLAFDNLKGDRALSCTELLQWADIIAIHGIRFVSLQYDGLIEDEKYVSGLSWLFIPETDQFND